MDDLWWRFADAAAAARERFEHWMIDRRHASRGAAAVRIGTGLLVIGLLLANFSTRDVWVGQASIWAEPARAVSSFPELALLDGVSPDVLAVVYLLTLAAATAFVAGWHTIQPSSPSRIDSNLVLVKTFSTSTFLSAATAPSS